MKIALLHKPIAILIGFLIALSGCELIPFATPVVVSGAGGGIAYTVTNVAYKTVSYPLSKVEGALKKALRKMDIKESKREKDEDGIHILALTKELEIHIDLEKVTPTATRIKVNAVKSTVFKDKATASEIIVQTEKNLDGS